ncbi:hypothetical protein Plhal304r1_c039g0117001 [Plasmopara halstedii]
MLIVQVKKKLILFWRSLSSMMAFKLFKAQESLLLERRCVCVSRDAQFAGDISTMRDRVTLTIQSLY